ncbi:MAG TPA: stage III sporulation protein AB [Ruminococcus sp.]|nr:stage III sporulation protein AB [Ruminococcus sp.]
MIRFIAALLFAVSGFMWGNSKSMQFKRKVEVCVQLDELLRFFDMRIRYRCDDVYEICRELDTASFSSLTFISLLPVDYSPCVDFHEAWCSAVTSQDELGDEEKNLLVRFGNVLGTCDAEGFHTAVEALRAELDILSSRRRDEYRTKGRVCRSIGPMLGIVAGLAVI